MKKPATESGLFDVEAGRNSWSQPNNPADKHTKPSPTIKLCGGL
jgi:hypothetical protein